MTSIADPRLSQSAKSLSRAAGAAVSLIGCIVLIGWLGDIAVLKSVLPGLATMKANTALAFVLIGMSLWLAGMVNPGVCLISRLCAAIVTCMALLTFSQDLLSWVLGIDQLLFKDPSTAAQMAAPGRMATATALNFLVLALALLFGDVETHRGYRPTEILALPATLSSLLALIGYLYGVTSLYRIAAYSSMALHTAVTFALLSAGVMCAPSPRLHGCADEPDYSRHHGPSSIARCGLHSLVHRLVEVDGAAEGLLRH
jgi:methyl-accepting chemotaxis protein